MSLKSLEIKKKHHYDWANYLSRWGSGSKNVFYTTKKGKIVHDSIRAILFEDFFYEITDLKKIDIEIIKEISKKSPEDLQRQHMSYLDPFLKIQELRKKYFDSGLSIKEIEDRIRALKFNQLENLHASHELAARPILDALAHEQLGVLNDRHLMCEFMMFFGQQIARTKNFRDICRSYPYNDPMQETVAKSIRHSWWFIGYMLGMNIGYSLFFDRAKHRHALLINNSSTPFITSDQPIVNVHDCISETEKSPPEYADFYYPISPRVAYIICESERFQKGKNEINADIVEELNRKLASQSLVIIIGSTEDSIRTFQKYIGKRNR